MSSTDIVNLESGVTSTSYRRIDICLIGSIVLLFILVLSGFTLALLFVLNPKGDMDKGTEPPAAFADAQRGMDPVYKGKNYAYLRAISAEVKEGVMKWEAIPYGSGLTMGSRYTYNNKTEALTVADEGTYFLYTQLHLTCSFQCKEETLTITFENQDNQEQLSCTVKMPENHFEPVVKKCWTVIPHLSKNSQLIARIRLHSTAENWQLEVNSSGFGMFLVDGP